MRCQTLRNFLPFILLSFPFYSFSFTVGNGSKINSPLDSIILIDTVRDANGQFSIFTYGINGNLLSVTDRNAQKTSYEYDENGRLKAEYFPNNSNKRYEYGENGLLSISVDEYGDSTLYYYNERKQLLKKDLPRKRFVEFSYNNRGLLSSAVNEDGFTNFSYDALGRLSSVEQNEQIVNYRYDETKGRRLITYPSGREVEESVDSLGRSLALRDGESFDLLADITDSTFIDSMYRVGLLAEFKHDEHHRLTGRTLGNNTSMDLAFDEENRIKGIIHQPNNFIAHNSIFDGEGNKILEENISQPALSRNFEYDTLNRLSKYSQGDPRWKKPKTEIVITYDKEGNRATMDRNGQLSEYETNDHNGYSKISQGESELRLEYDKQQNLLFDGNFHYLFDSERRLKMVFGNSTFPYADVRATYSYDAFGKITKIIRGKETRRYFYDEHRLIEEQDGDGLVLATFVYEPNSERLVSMRRNDKNYFYHYDAEGSVIALTNEKGEVVEQYFYDINGKMRVKTAYADLVYSAAGNLFTFGGMLLDETTGLYQHRSSFYNTEIGRRMTKGEAVYLNPQSLIPYPSPSDLSYTDSRSIFSSRRRIGLGSTEEKVLIIWASLAARGNAYSFNNGAEFMERMQMETTKCGCIEETVVVSHGWGWPITKGQQVNGGIYGTVWINGFLGDIPPNRVGEGFKITKHARELKDLEAAIRQQRVRFCSSCHIVLTGCRVASTGNFVTRLAKMTGCTVLASHGGCSGYEAPHFTSGPKTTTERDAGEFKGFSLTYPDGRRDLLQNILRLW